MKIILPPIHSCLVIALCVSPAFTSSAYSDEGAASGPAQNEQDVLHYWTLERMQEAANIDDPANFVPEEPVLPGGDDHGYALVSRPYKLHQPSRITGVLFYHNVSVDKDTHCSASILDTPSRSVVVTAAHCVIFPNPQGSPWSTHVLFVPAYDGTGVKSLEERAPYGRWPIKHAFVTKVIAQSPFRVVDATYDLSLVSVYPQNNRRLEDVVGTGWQAKINDAETFSSATIIGYPAKPYDGYTQYRCNTRLAEDLYGGMPSPNCGIVGGNSGGPVVTGSQVVGVVHGKEQTRLRSESFPSLEAAANVDVP